MRLSRRIAVLFLGLLATPALLASQTVQALGFGQRYDLPVPLWLYLYGAAPTVILSLPQSPSPRPARADAPLWNALRAVPDAARGRHIAKAFVRVGSPKGSSRNKLAECARLMYPGWHG